MTTKLVSTGVEFPDATIQTSKGVKVSGDTMTGDLSLGDNVKAKFGASDDLQIYHDGTVNHIGGITEDASGNVGIGTSTLYGKTTIEHGTGINNGLTLSVSDATANGNITGIQFSTNSVVSRPRAAIYSESVDSQGIAGWGADLVFATRSAPDSSTISTADERLRIDSSGNILTGSGKFKQNSTSNSNGAMNLVGELAGSYKCISFERTTSGGEVGSIVANTSSTSYNTSSDYRLKENVVPMTGSIDRLKALKPSRFNFIADADTTVDGFLAHEAGEVVPECATGEKDAMKTEEYEVTPALGEVFTPAVEEVTEERQVMETIETGTYVNLAGETITETSEVGQTIEVTTTVIERQDIEGVMTEVEVEKVSQEPVMETVVTTEAVAEVILESNVEKPEEGNWREVTPAEMGTREVPDYQGIDQAKLVPLLVATVQELIAEVEALKNA